MKRVLVLDANQRSALATTRSLGKKGVPLITADETTTALAACSYFSQDYFSYPSPQTSPMDFVDTITTIIKNNHIDIILPMTELTTSLLLENSQAFPSITLPFPSLITIESLANKCSLMRLAESLKIPIPNTVYVNDPKSINFNLDAITYPAVLKPSKSWLYEEGEWLHSTVRFADNKLILKDIIEDDPAFRSHPYMVQERVSGSGQGLFALYDNGSPIVFFSHRRLREKPPWGGVSVLSESVEVDPVLLGHARALLDKVGWHGIAMVEFKVSGDGTPYLMEVNTRPWGSLQLAIDAGVDFPWLLYQVACGDHPDPIRRYKVGNRLRWLLGDLDSLYITLKSKHFPVREKICAIRQFLTPDFFHTRHEVNRWGDIAPFWWELRRYLKDLWH